MLSLVHFVNVTFAYISFWNVDVGMNRTSWTVGVIKRQQPAVRVMPWKQSQTSKHRRRQSCWKLRRSITFARCIPNTTANVISSSDSGERRSGWLARNVTIRTSHCVSASLAFWMRCLLHTSEDSVAKPGGTLGLTPRE